MQAYVKDRGLELDADGNTYLIPIFCELELRPPAAAAAAGIDAEILKPLNQARKMANKLLSPDRQRLGANCVDRF